jgi:hypothetical protein
MRPTCCGKNATPYCKTYPRSWENGFRCKRCGSIRLPMFPTNYFADSRLMLEMPAVRAAGMAYWNENYDDILM